MAKSVEMVETLANVDQYSPLVVTFIVADTIASFFLSFFSPQFQHIRFGETRPFAAARVSLSLFLLPSFASTSRKCACIGPTIVRMDT